MLGEYDEDEVRRCLGEDYGEAGEDDSLPPPNEPEEEKELLFLIEFLVDTLNVRPDALAKERLDPCTLQGQHCIVLTFLHFPPMSICEKDLDDEKNVGSEETVFNAGKSLVFALTESQFEDPPPVFLEVTAFKEMPHGFPFPRVEIGKTKIDLSELFRLVFDKYDEKPEEVPVAKSIKDNYLLYSDGEETASADMYIRLTCLGQNIVTEFQKSDGVCEPFLFKNLESEKIYECRQTTPRRGATPVPKLRRDLPTEAEPDPEDENYEEIFAEINGSALTVAVEKSRRKDKPKPYRVEDFCDCDIALPAKLVEGISELSVTPVTAGKQELPDGGVGKCNDKIIFQIPPSEKLVQPDGRNSVSYKVNTCNEGEKHGHAGKNSFKIVTNDDVNRPKMPDDPEKDVFVLRIIKRGRCKTGKNGKNALELEFRTPKEKIVPPPKPPYMIDVGVGPDKQKEKKGK